MKPEYLEEGTVLLPGGLVLEGGRALRHATLRPLSGREEEWLVRHRQMPNAARVTWLLQACVLSLADVPVTTDLARQMLVGDREFLVLQLRRLTLGDDVHAVVVCPACENRMDTDFRTSEVPVESRPQTSSTLTARLADRIIRFRLPTGGDQEAVVGKSTETAGDELFQRCLVDDGGKAPSAEEKQTIIEAMERAAPLVELELDLTCPDCRHH